MGRADDGDGRAGRPGRPEPPGRPGRPGRLGRPIRLGRSGGFCALVIMLGGFLVDDFSSIGEAILNANRSLKCFIVFLVEVVGI